MYLIKVYIIIFYCGDDNPSQPSGLGAIFQQVMSSGSAGVIPTYSRQDIKSRKRIILPWLSVRPRMTEANKYFVPSNVRENPKRKICTDSFCFPRSKSMLRWCFSASTDVVSSHPAEVHNFNEVH